MAGDQNSDAALRQFMIYSKEPTKEPTKEPQKAVYAIREVCQKDVYQTRGMGCLVHTTKGSERLLTWSGVDLGKGDRINSIIMDRFISLKSSSDHEIGEYRFKRSTVNEFGSFSFLSVGPVNEAGNANPNKNDWREYLKLQVPEETKCDFKAYSFVGNKDVKLDLKYNVTRKEHELVVNSGISKKHILEKTAILGAPIIVDVGKDKEYRVVGVVGWSDDDRRLIPYFITEELLSDQESSSREASSGEDRTDSLVHPPIEQKPSTNGNPKNGTAGITAQQKHATELDLNGRQVTDSPVQPPKKQEQPTSAGDSSNIVTGIRGIQPASTSASTDRGPIEESSEKGPIEESSEKVGEFDLKLLPYLALDIQAAGKEKWKSFGRYLHLDDGTLNGIASDNDEEYERCYKMLITWYHKSATHSFKDLAGVLKRMKLNGIYEDYCLSGHVPSTGKEVETANLKKGVVEDGDLTKIAEAVTRKRRRFGRALGVSDDVLDEIVEENKGNVSEQSYQILRKWKQSNKQRDITYKKLAQALLDRTVAMETVMSKFCLVVGK